MPYDALGNYIPGDDEPSLDQMRLALTKAQRPLDVATQKLKQVATEFNPLMATRTLQDIPRVAYNTLVAPLASTWADVLSNIQATGAAKAFGALGMPQEAQEAQARVRQVSPTRFQAPLQSQTGEAFQEELGKAFEASKAPHMWPLTPPAAGARPFLTPNDVRVIGAEATRLGRQVRDIPTDFSNAQSGFTRIDPITGQPTMGARLQGTAEDVGRIVEQRRAAGQSPIPGVPEVLTPETRAYAVRPAGTSLTMPQGLPKGMEARELPSGTAVFRAIEDVIGPVGTKMNIDDVTGQLNYMRDRAPDINQRAFGEFEKRKAMERYPDAPTPEDAFEALMTATPPDERKLLTLKHFDEFRQTPEGIAAGYGQLPSSTELMERDAAARQWLQGPFVNYFKKHFGAVGDPMVKLASEGITYMPRHGIEPLDVDLELKTVRDRREAAGLPVEGTVAPALHVAEAKLSEAEAKVTELNTQRERYRDVAMQQGLHDPALLPEYAATTNQINRAIAERDKIQEQVQNLELGKLYEDRADMGVQPRTPESILKGMDYRVKQFYPSVTRAQPGEKLYTTHGASAVRNLAYDEFATEFYNKVLEGKIPLDKLKNLTVEKAVRQLAEPRIAKEKAEAKAALTFKTDAETVMKNTLRQYAKPENYFGNVGAIALTKDMGLDIPTMTKILSEDTTVLDHCIATGGSGGGKKNLWFPNNPRTHQAIYDVVTGEKNPGVGRDTSSYVSAILAGDSITSFRDANTGLPVATFQLHRSHIGQDGQQKYSIGYASGHQNDAVSPEYIDGIKDYLNANESMIAGAGSNLSENLDIHDTQDLSTVRKDLSLKRTDADLVDWQSMPRFVTGDEIKATIQATKDMQRSTQAPAVRPEPEQPVDALPQALRDDIQSAMNNAVTSVAEAGDAASNAGEAARRLEIALNHFLDISLGENATLADVEQMISSLRASANTYRGTAVGTMVANGMEEFITDLEGIRSAANRGHYAPAAPEISDQQLAVTREVYIRGLDVARRTLSPENMNNLVAAIEDIAANMGLPPTPTALIGERFPTFAAGLRRASETTGSNTPVGVALADLANRIDPLPATQQAPTFDVVDFDNFVGDIRQNVDAQVAHDIVRISNTEANFLGTNIRGALANQPTEFAQRLADEAEHADNAMLEEALRDLADRIAPPVRDPAAQAAAELMAEPEPQQQQVTRFTPLLADVADATYNQLREAMTPAEQGEVAATHDDLVRANPNPDALRQIAELVFNHQMSEWQGFPDTARAMLYMELLSTANRMEADRNRGQAVTAPQLSATQANAVDDAVYQFDTALQELADTEGTWQVAIREVDRALEELQDGERQIYGLWDADEITPGIRQALRNRLESLRQEYLSNDMPPDEGQAEGGSVRGYQDGGKVSYPPFYRASNQAITRAQEMYPNEQGQDDRVDAARHMLASGYATQSFGPMIAKGLGYAHELKEAPIRTAGSWLGLSKPRYDYAMDVHNNALGVELAQKAKDRSDFERLVQESIAAGRARTLTPEQANAGREALKYANGGTVPQTQSLDDMKYELLMRSK